MASVKRVEKKNGQVVYRIRVSLGEDKSGKQIVKVSTYTVKQTATPKQQEREANQYAMALEDRLKNGESYEGEEMSFEDYAEKWLANAKTELAYSTYESYTHIINDVILPHFKTYKVARIRTPNIEIFYKSLMGRYSNGSIRKIANVMSGMFRTAVRWQMIQINPCRDAKVPKNDEEEPQLKFFTPEQSLMFLETLNTRFYRKVRGHQRIDDTGKPYNVADYQEPYQTSTQLIVFYTLSLYCGFRKGETLALHWSDIDFEKREIHISKSVGMSEDGIVLKKPKTATSVRTVSFPAAIVPLLKQYRQEYNIYRLSTGDKWQGNGNLFIQWNGKIMDRSTPYHYFKHHIEFVNKWIKEHEGEAKERGFEELPTIPLHGLRHSCATLLNYLDINLIDISKILGHAKSSTTMDIYAHSFEKQNKEAANKIDDFLEQSAGKAV
ncbi:tyrosine-type recombinase/integrase [Bilifractor porci]|uniref:Site-specific integrase n=1 Tax=Bilifractor porci TaxID=2606636 RepID=A0A7X2P982_9FIRM|nr:site-specific integrase [Bilifractor porci]MST82501.1 site-specific integrase [Bilifractor porci]